ncbi:MAG: hypothetical protein COC22_04945 [Flavobacteriaceae bacterium]|nr:MAG: hypothetical protein COC22_04945 [Flavobacteriaceae bacterium]
MFVITSVFTVSSLWVLIQPLLKKEQQFEKLEIEHVKFKRNFTLFNAALDLTSLDTAIPYINELIFGNKQKEASLKLMVITNPMCGYCKESHKLIENILKKEYPEIQVTIRFNVNPDNIESEGTKIAAKILEVYETTNEKSCLNALSEIYGEMDAETWLNKWGKTINTDSITTLKKEKYWCNFNKINFTPAILINGKQYPKEYDRMDLLYFIDELIEEQLELKSTQFVMVNT